MTCLIRTYDSSGIDGSLLKALLRAGFADLTLLLAENDAASHLLPSVAAAAKAAGRQLAPGSVIGGGRAQALHVLSCVSGTSGSSGASQKSVSCWLAMYATHACVSCCLLLHQIGQWKTLPAFLPGHQTCAIAACPQPCLQGHTGFLMKTEGVFDVGDYPFAVQAASRVLVPC